MLQDVAKFPERLRDATHQPTAILSPGLAASQEVMADILETTYLPGPPMERDLTWKLSPMLPVFGLLGTGPYSRR